MDPGIIVYGYMDIFFCCIVGKDKWYEEMVLEHMLVYYLFDKKLCILLFNEIEKIEVAIRSVLANIGCQELGDRYWITKPEYFANADRFNQTLAVIEKELASSKEDYIEDFRCNYVENYPPAWMITEVLSFGNLNYIYSNIANNRLMKRIGDYFGLKPQVFTSWLTVLANLRNMCCHHARVWNRDFMLNPVEPRKTSNAWIDTSRIDKKKIFYRLCIIRYFLISVSPNNNLNEKLLDLFVLFPFALLCSRFFDNGIDVIFSKANLFGCLLGLFNQ